MLVSTERLPQCKAKILRILTARMYVKAEAGFKLHKWKTNDERVRWQIKNTSKQKIAPQIAI
jgi:hypothetical protein